MKTALTITCLALTGCTAFTSPRDPLTGIRQDAPPEWADSPNPLDTIYVLPPPHPAEGHFGRHWKGYRGF